MCIIRHLSETEILNCLLQEQKTARVCYAYFFLLNLFFILLYKLSARNKARFLHVIGLLLAMSQIFSSVKRSQYLSIKSILIIYTYIIYFYNFNFRSKCKDKSSLDSPSWRAYAHMCLNHLIITKSKENILSYRLHQHT